MRDTAGSTRTVGCWLYTVTGAGQRLQLKTTTMQMRRCKCRPMVLPMSRVSDGAALQRARQLKANRPFCKHGMRARVMRNTCVVSEIVLSLCRGYPALG